MAVYTDILVSYSVVSVEGPSALVIFIFLIYNVDALPV